jgi:site-specific DNA-cytosine methylase
MRSWDACEVLGDLGPLHDFMEILEVRSADGDYASSPLGSGTDAQALTCQGLVNVSEYYKEVQDEYEVNQGEIRVGIVPWDSVEEAEASYIDRSVTDHERWLSEGQEEILRIELGGEWDEGVVLGLREGNFDSIDAIGRHGTWLVHVHVHYNHDRYPSYFETNREAGLLDGDPDDYVSYPFTTEGLAEWISSQYMTQVYEQVSQRISEE